MRGAEISRRGVEEHRRMESKKDAGWRKGGRERCVSLDNVAEMMKKKRDELEGEEMTGKIYLEKVRRHKACRKKRKVRRKKSWPRC